MRALVTGGAGFIGSHLVNLLVEEDWEVTVIDDFSTIDYSSVGPDKVHMMTDRVQDVGLAQISEVDVIFHLAGKVGPVGVLKFAGQIAIDTLASADRVGKLAARQNVPLIFVSTSEVYGSPDSLNSEDTPKVFRGPPSARQEYASSRLAAEIMLLNRRIDVRVVRPFNVTGPRQSTRGGFVIPRFVQQALAGDPLTVYTPGTQQRSFTHVADIVEGMMLVHEAGKPKGIYNLGNPDNTCSIRQLAEEIVLATNSKSEISIVDPATLHGPDFREAPDKLPNAQKAMDELGWVPQYSRADVIADAIRERTDF